MSDISVPVDISEEDQKEAPHFYQNVFSGGGN